METLVWRPPVLRTERLVIRPFSATDFPAMRAYASELPATEYGSWLGGAGPADAARYLVDTVARYGRPPRCDLGVALDGRLVGGVAFRQVWLAPPTMEIGWVLHPEAAGRGMAREAVSALVGWLFENFADLRRLEARVRVSDVHGIKLLERLGFLQEGTIRTAPDETGDTGFYGLLRGEWAS